MNGVRKLACGVALCLLTGVASAAVYRVSPSGTGDGSSWAQAMSLANAVETAEADDTLLLKAGEYVVAAQLKISKSITIKGGLAGTDDTTLAADPVSTFNACDNTGFESMVSVSTASGAGNVFERICFTRGYVRGLVKTGGANISFKNCRFYQNGGTYNPNAAFSGVGAHLTGTSAVEAWFDNCVFDYNARTNYPGNRNTCMQGAGFYATGFKRVFVDDCLFATNCGIMGISGEYGQDKGDGGGAIYVSGQPLTVRNTRFIANNTPGRSSRGGTVRITGSSGGTAFSNCTFVANCTKYSSGSTSLGAPISISSGAVADKYDIYGCTFAYNITASTTSSAGLTVDKGTVKVRNSIFYGNTALNISAHYGREIAVYSNGKLDIDYSLLTGSDDSYISSSVAANLTCGDHMVYGDPCFGTTLAQAKALKNGDYYNVKKYAELYAIDVHENALGTGYSKALDTGDPTSPYANEPSPNGARVNLGVYGNTANAATSVAAAPSLAGTLEDGIVFASDTKPTVTVTLAGEKNYNANVKIEIGTNDFEKAGAETMESISQGGLQSGESFALASANLFKPDSTLYVRVTVSSANQADQIFYASKKVTGKLPYYYGHGGGATVIHVREGASGLNTGKNWTDAFPDMKTALSALTAAHKELWIAGRIQMQMAPSTVTIPASLVVRGGFYGDEDRADERTAGRYATLDGAHNYGVLYFSNAAANPVTVERVVFTQAKGRGLYKEGAGDLTLVDCKFHSNGWYCEDIGRGLCVYGSSGSTVVTVTNCQFRGNFKHDGGSSFCRAGAIYANAIKRLVVDDSLFVTNGCNPTAGIARGTPGRDWCNGASVWCEGVPTTMRNVHFRADRSGIRGDGGGVFLVSGTTAPSAFTNCSWVGATEGYAESDITSHTGTRGGAVVLSLGSTEATADFQNCVIAYNLSDAPYVGGGLLVEKGTANFRNSIIWQNYRGSLSSRGADIHVMANGRLNLSYVRLTALDAEGKPPVSSVTEASEGLITYDHVSQGDPKFVTSKAFVDSKIVTSGNYTYYNNNAATAAARANFDVHLQSAGGYYLNDGTFVTGTVVTSDCIDAGDPDDPRYVNEPHPNGDVINLGAYGGTSRASVSPLAQPSIVGGLVSVTFPNGYSMPQFDFDMGGDGEYNATVTIYGNEGEPGEIGYAFTNIITGVVRGQHISSLMSSALHEGNTLYWKVLVTANQAEDVTKTGTTEITGRIPGWAGRGGGANVIHVWPDVIGGDRSGKGGWMNACDSLETAITMLSEERNEIWVLAATNPLPKKITLAPLYPMTLRGGFRNWENSPSERQPGAATRFDGGQTNEVFAIVNGKDIPVTLDALEIVGAYEHGINKTGAGDLTLLNCRFLNNSYTSAAIDGRGAYVAGDGTTKLVVSNCYFGGNGPLNIKRNHAYLKGNGHGLYVASCGRATFDDCVFATNGMYGVSTTLSDSCAGTAIYANGTPVTVRRTMFLGNRGAVRDNGNYLGGTVRLSGGCGGSAFTNCAFVGNSAYCGWGDHPDTHGGSLVLTLGATAQSADVVNCTFAYNYVNGTSSPGGLNVYTGTANVKNCIFARNGVSGRTMSGATRKAADIDVKASGVCHVTYTLLSTNDVTSCDVADGGVLDLGTGVIYGDPQLMMTNRIASYTADSGLALCYPSFLRQVNVHLRGRYGYTDEVTAQVVRWRKTDEQSPAIDAGDPASDYANEPRSCNGKRVNLGAYGNTPYATMSAAQRFYLIIR